MKWLWPAIVLPVVLLFLWIWQKRRSGITGEASRNKHFRKLATELGFSAITDGYFLQLEGFINNARTIIYPHHFEGPGLVTLIYMETSLPAQDRNWIEPNVSLGRALVGWKRKIACDFELSGSQLDIGAVQSLLERFKDSYAYSAVTLPHRFSYSPLLQKSLASWTNFMIFIALDAGRRPSIEEIRRALQDAATLSGLIHA